MGVQRQIAGEPGQQVLAVRDMSQHGMPGEVRGRVCGHPQFAVGRHAIAQRLVEAAGQCVYTVSPSGTPPSSSSAPRPSGRVTVRLFVGTEQIQPLKI